MKLPTFKTRETPADEKGREQEPCAACGEHCFPDEASKLCRPCWRVVVLGGSDVVMEAGLRACKRLDDELKIGKRK